jgi:hypothetical protein
MAALFLRFWWVVVAVWAVLTAILLRAISSDIVSFFSTIH